MRPLVILEHVNKKPAFLDPHNARVTIAAPSSFANIMLIEKASEKLPFQFNKPSGLYKQFGQMAGTIHHRASLLENALKDDSDAIIFASGGHRSAELVPLINWTILSNITPKWIMGMSDNSAILNSITHRLGWTTLLGPTMHQIAKRDLDYATPAISFLNGGIKSMPLNYTGQPIKGRVVACTLSLLPLIIANEGRDYFKDTILCLEDIAEEYSTIDRLFLHAKLSGLFDECVKAVILGDFTDMRDTGRSFGFSIDDIARHHTGDFPLATNAPFGHGEKCHPIPIGADAILDNNTLVFNL